MRAVPAKAVALIAKWEGLREKAYICPAGVPTIGYGHTRTVTHVDVRNMRRITKEFAEELLRGDAQEAVTKIYTHVGREVVDALTEDQYAALVSFVFNLGLKGQWGITFALNQRRFDAVPAQMRKFVMAGGKRLKGLVDRREDEAQLWGGNWP